MRRYGNAFAASKPISSSSTRFIIRPPSPRHAEKIPWASVSNSLNPVLPRHLDSALLQTIGDLAQRRAAIFNEYGASPAFRGADVLSPYLNIAFTTEALCGPSKVSNSLARPFLCGTGVTRFALKAIPADRPIVYASFGSQIYHWPEIFAKLRAAASRLAVHLVLSAGELIHRIEPSSNCQVYRYAPQRGDTGNTPRFHHPWWRQ